MKTKQEIYKALGEGHTLFSKASKHLVRFIDGELKKKHLNNVTWVECTYRFNMPKFWEIYYGKLETSELQDLRNKVHALNERVKLLEGQVLETGNWH